MTHKQMILRHMERFGSITSLEAMQEYGIMRLGARICDLRRAGYDIAAEIVADENRFGDAVHYARYTLRQPEGKDEQNADS